MGVRTRRIARTGAFAHPDKRAQTPILLPALFFFFSTRKHTHQHTLAHSRAHARTLTYIWKSSHAHARTHKCSLRLYECTRAHSVRTLTRERARAGTHAQARTRTNMPALVSARLVCGTSGCQMWLGRDTPRDVAKDKHAFDAAVKKGADDAVKRALDAAANGAADPRVKAAAAMRFKVGDEVVDHDGERCRVANVDPADADKPYELEYPDGSRFWTAESAIRPHKVRSHMVLGLGLRP
jgi:hypothetical protein